MGFTLFRRYFIALKAALLLSLFSPGANAQPPDRTLLVLGDSLSAEYGLPRGQGWVALLMQRLAERQPPVRVVNASISGETTAGGKSRLPSLMQQHRPNLVIIELGGNDALRGLSLEATQANLAAMVDSARSGGARVLILGMQVPPNYGSDYARRFAAVFTRVAREHQANVVPFLLKGLADGPEPLRWFQADRIHPNLAAQPLMLDNVWPELKKLL